MSRLNGGPCVSEDKMTMPVSFPLPKTRKLPAMHLLVQKVDVFGLTVLFCGLNKHVSDPSKGSQKGVLFEQTWSNSTDDPQPFGLVCKLKARSAMFVRGQLPVKTRAKCINFLWAANLL